MDEQQLTDELLSLSQEQDRLLQVLAMILKLNDIPIGDDLQDRLERAKTRMGAVQREVIRINKASVQ